MKANEIVPAVEEQFSNEFWTILVAKLTKDTGTAWHYRGLAGDGALRSSDNFIVQILFAGAIRGVIKVEIENEGARVLAGAVIGESPGEMGKRESDALSEFLKNVVSELSVSLSATYGVFTATISLSADLLDQIDAASTTVVEGDLAHEGSAEIAVRVCLSKDFVEVLSSIAREAIERAPAEVETLDGQVNLELVLDVELNVTLRFGRRQLTLREVLDLTSGSVIELDRQVEEPVELLLDGKVIAKGEAVVIDGNYGLRVTEVPNNLGTGIL